MNIDFSKIGVIGSHGMVGTQVRKWFERNGEVFCFDKGKNIGSIEELNKADVIFVCVPTPYMEDNEYDLSYVKEAIANIKDGKLVVIKSTVNPGTTDYFQTAYPNKVFLFSPEFLTELSAYEDFVKPDMQVLGVPYQAYEHASKIMLMLPPSPVMRIVSPIDAEWVKKLRNAFYALKVVFFNQMYDVVSQVGGDYETVRSIVVEDPKIGNSHSLPFHKGGRGAGGACLPKDLNSLVDFIEHHGLSSPLLEKVRDLNEWYLKNNPKTYKSIPMNILSSASDKVVAGKYNGEI